MQTLQKRKTFTTLAGAMLATTALMAAPALADVHMSGENAYTTGTVSEDMDRNLIRARDIIGGEIYSLGDTYDSQMWSDTMMYDAVDTNWTQIGEIEDIVLSPSGEMTGIVAEVGGFLDIADTHVVIRLDEVKLVAVDDQSYAYVTMRTEEELENLPEVDEAWYN